MRKSKPRDDTKAPMRQPKCTLRVASDEHPVSGTPHTARSRRRT